jgi:hypothetical protein
VAEAASAEAAAAEAAAAVEAVAAGGAADALGARTTLAPELPKEPGGGVGKSFIMKINSNDTIFCDNIVNKQDINILK